MQEILINIHTKNTKLHNYYIESFFDLYKKYTLKTFIFTEKINSEDKKRKNQLEKKGIYLLEYSSQENITIQIKNLNNTYKIKYINAFNENLVNLANYLKQEIGQQLTKNFELFRNKKIQRELLLKYNKDITVNFLEKKLIDLNFEKLKKDFGVPFILKPKDGFESSGVAKISSKKDFEKYKKINNNNIEILVEEFIDGEMFTISEYIDEKGNIIYTPIVKNKLGIEINIDDFFIFSRSITHKTGNYIKKEQLKIFIFDTIKACNIKNTFIHHEFKLTSSGKLKTIELNGRIGGFRLEMYKESYNYNLFDGLFGKKCDNNLKNNISSIAIYPEKNCKLISYNYELIEKIKKLESFLSINIKPEKFEGKEIGLTKNGFTKVGTIKLKNSNYKEFKKDYNFIEKNYKNLLIIEEKGKLG